MHFVKDGRTIFIAIFKTQYSKLNIRVIKCRHFLEPVKNVLCKIGLHVLFMIFFFLWKVLVLGDGEQSVINY